MGVRHILEHLALSVLLLPLGDPTGVGEGLDRKVWVGAPKG